MTHNNFFAMLTASLFSVGATLSSASANEYIIIKGLSVTSTIAEIEAVFGPCGDSDENGWHTCGGSDINAYKLRKNGGISEISFACDVLNACQHPVNALAKIIKSERNSIIDQDIHVWELGTKVTLYGSAGDVITLQSFRDDGTNAFISLGFISKINLD